MPLLLAAGAAALARPHPLRQPRSGAAVQRDGLLERRALVAAGRGRGRDALVRLSSRSASSRSGCPRSCLRYREPASLPAVATPFRSSPSRPLAGDLRCADLVSAEEAFLGSQVGGLVRLLAEKDAYTEGHTRRVALLAVAVGEELGLAPARLRELATGGLLHDIGKLSVPDEVLDGEYAVVQKHAASRRPSGWSSATWRWRSSVSGRPGV